MKSLFKHILPLIAVIVFASCNKDGAEVIPRSKMADIYAEMLMTDQWISNTPGMRLIADTSLVYEPILQKYGYDNLDYIKSVDHYMNDPERFARILRSSVDILDKRLVELRKKQKQLELEEELKKKVLKHHADHSFDEYFPYLADEPYVHYYDSVAFEPDSFNVYRLVSIETADTLYDRIEMIIRVDSLAINDTLSVKDSLSVSDSLAVSDMVDIRKNIDSLSRKVSDTISNNLMTDRRKIWQVRE